MTQKLDGGDVFPSTSLNLVGGGSIRLPEDLETPFGMILFYRGHW
jgi:hypothetical protein